MIFYLSDLLNYFELGSLSLLLLALLQLATIGLGLGEADPIVMKGEDSNSSQVLDFSNERAARSSIFSAALVLLWLSQGLRLLSRSNKTGPLVLMFIHMILTDITRWLLLTLVIFVAFAASFYHLLRDQIVVLDGGGNTECAASLGNSFILGDDERFLSNAGWMLNKNHLRTLVSIFGGYSQLLHTTLNTGEANIPCVSLQGTDLLYVHMHPMHVVYTCTCASSRVWHAYGMCTDVGDAHARGRDLAHVHLPCHVEHSADEHAHRHDGQDLRPVPPPSSLTPHVSLALSLPQLLAHRIPLCVPSRSPPPLPPLLPGTMRSSSLSTRSSSCSRSSPSPTRIR